MIQHCQWMEGLPFLAGGGVLTSNIYILILVFLC
jgi:hypothetical protein